MRPHNGASEREGMQTCRLDSARVTGAATTGLAAKWLRVRKGRCTASYGQAGSERWKTAETPERVT
jgi:hypothetical protein